MKGTDMTNRMDQMIDEFEVRRVVEGYMHAVDSNDYGGIAACFMEDAALTYAMDPFKFIGGKAVADWMRSFDEIPTTHTVSNCRIVVDGDTASSDMFATAVIVIGESGPGSIQTVGVRYTDDLQRTAAGWKISKRTHAIIWQINNEAVPVGLDVES
ncbi:nuclear transport factor 2 family protein [Roseibium sp. HPY-6]|uniref:nuclear transport factor 2 family protein n=1 Tax=Roseibium sp. HPY-6 TaxID=3229852 RepID=UPI00338E3224